MSDEIQVSSFTRRVAAFIVGHPLWSILIGLGLVAASLAGVPRVRADFTHRGFFWDHDPHMLAFDAFERRFGNDDAVVIAVHSPSGVFDMDTATLLQELTARMWKVPEIIRVDSLANYNWVHAEGDDIQVEPLFPETLTPEILAHRERVALSHEILPKYLVSTDAKVAMVVARVKPGLDRPPNSPLITEETRRAVAELARTDHEIHVTGGPPITYAFQEVAVHDLSRLLPIAIATAAIFLLVVLRSVAGVLLPIGLLLVTVAATFGFAGWAKIPLTTMSTAIPSIMIAACVADGVHVLMTFYQELKRGRPRRDAARRSLELNFLPTFLTSLTTAMGLASFASANLKPVAGLGFMAAYGAMLAWVLTLLVLGGLITLLPLRAGRVTGEAGTLDQRLAARWTAFLARRRVPIIVVGTAITLGAFALAMTNDVNSDPFKYFRRSVPVRDANEFVERTVGGSRGFELVIEAGAEDGIKDPAFLRKVEALQRWIEAMPQVTRAVSIVDVLKQLNRSLNGDQQEFYRLPDDRAAVAQQLFLYTMSLPQGMDINDRVTIKNDALRMTVLNTIATSREAMAAVSRMETHARSLGLEVHATGKYSLYQRTNGYVVEAFLTSFFAALLGIAAVMMIFLRSIKLGLLSMLPNVVPVVIGGAFLKIIGQPLDIGTVLVGAVCLGIAVDDTVHVLANYRRLRTQGFGRNESMQTSLAHVGRALIATTAILVVSFGSFVLADFTPNLYFGLLTAVVLGVALLCDLTMTCAILVASSPSASSTPAKALSTASASASSAAAT